MLVLLTHVTVHQVTQARIVKSLPVPAIHVLMVVLVQIQDQLILALVLPDLAVLIAKQHHVQVSHVTMEETVPLLVPHSFALVRLGSQVQHVIMIHAQVLHVLMEVHVL